MLDRAKEIELLKAELETVKDKHSPLPATKSDLDNVSTTKHILIAVHNQILCCLLHTPCFAFGNTSTCML